MKKIAVLMMVFVCLASVLSFAEDANDPQAAIEQLLQGNEIYLLSEDEDVSQGLRTETTLNGQAPYAVVITCSDSRVPAELIFDAGIGELFVIRTAGNVIGEFELGSIEYGAEHLHVPLVIVMGHTHCGAVDAALNGGAHGNIAAITDAISKCLPENCDARQAEILNVLNSIAIIRTSEIMLALEKSGETMILGAIYDIESGRVEFLKD